MRKEEIVEWINIEEIQPSPYQMREVIIDSELQELAASIKEHGVLQPIIVRHIDNKFELVAGARRLAACRLAKQEKVPAIIREVSQQEALAWSVVENVHRKDPTLLQMARALQNLAEPFGGNPNPVAEMIGKSSFLVKVLIRILSMPSRVQELSEELGISKLQLLQQLSQEEQIDFAEKAVKNNWTILQLQAYLQGILPEKGRPVAQAKDTEAQVDYTKKEVLKVLLKLRVLVRQLENRSDSQTIKKELRKDHYFGKNLQEIEASINLLKNI